MGQKRNADALNHHLAGHTHLYNARVNELEEIIKAKNQELDDMARRSEDNITSLRQTLEDERREQGRRYGHDKKAMTMEIENLTHNFQQAVHQMDEKDHDLRNAAANVVEVSNQLKTLRTRTHGPQEITDL